MIKFSDKKTSLLKKIIYIKFQVRVKKPFITN
jgi:hypothetical protein